MTRQLARVRTALLAVALVVSPAVTRGTAPPAFDEYEVKAAFLLNLARFVEWPRESFASATDPVTFCVVGRDPFGRVLDHSLDGRLVSGRPVAIERRAAVGADAGRCHVVFTESASPELVAALDGRSVLTVGDAEGFAKGGGMIGLFLDDQRVRFEVNLASAERAHLRISSRVLALASAVYSRPDGLK